MTRNEPDLPEAHEPSYYEIALTNRQVVAAFVVLLACVIVSFLGGLWVGRESATREAEAVLRDTPPPAQVAETGAPANSKLDFFSVPQGSTQVDPNDKAGKGTLREDLDRRDQTLGTPSLDPNGGVETADATDAAEEPAPPPPVEKAPPAKAPAPEPRPDKKPAKAEKGGKAERGDPEPPKGSFVVQVFSTSERDQAVKVRNRLTGGGEKAYLSPVKASGGTMYRVRIGPFTSRDAAQKVADKVRKGYRLDTWVTQ